MARIPDRYHSAVEKIGRETGADEDSAYAMILLTATLVDLCPWDDLVTEMIITDARRSKDVDLRKPESCAG